MKLAVIIVSWNTRELAIQCLRSLSSIANRDIANWHSDTWLVDNASSDSTVEAVRGEFPATRIILNQANLGYAGGANSALRELGFPNGSAVPDAVFLLNPDTLIQPSALLELLRVLEEYPKAGLVGGQLSFGDGTFQHSAFTFPGLRQLAVELLPPLGRFYDSPFNGRYPRKRYETGKPFRVDFPLGAAFLIRGAAINDAGLMDEAFNLYCEEIDWAMRMRQRGWQAYCAPAARIIHLGGQSTSQIRVISFTYLWRSRYRLYRKHYSILRVCLARLIVCAGMCYLRRKAQRSMAREELSATEGAAWLQAQTQVTEIWHKGILND